MIMVQSKLLKAALQKWLNFSVEGVNAEYALRSLLQRNLMTRVLKLWRTALKCKHRLLRLLTLFTVHRLRQAWDRWCGSPMALKLDTSSFITPVLRRERDQVCDCIYRICTGDHCKCTLVTHARLRLKTVGNYIEYAQAASQASETVKQRSRVKATTPSKLTPERPTSTSRLEDMSRISVASTKSKIQDRKTSGRKAMPTRQKSSTLSLSSVKAAYTPRKTATPTGRIEGHRALDSSMGYMSMRTSLSLSEQSFDRTATSTSFSHWDLTPFKEKQRRRD